MVDKNEDGERLVIRLDIDLRKHTCSWHRRRSASLLNKARGDTSSKARSRSRGRRSAARSTSHSRSTSFFSETDSIPPVAQKKARESSGAPLHVELFRELQQFIRYLQVKYKIEDFSVAPVPQPQCLSQEPTLPSASSNTDTKSRPTPTQLSESYGLSNQTPASMPSDTQNPSKLPPTASSGAENPSKQLSGSEAPSSKSSIPSSRKMMRKRELKAMKSIRQRLTQMEKEKAEALNIKQPPEPIDPVVPATAGVMAALTSLTPELSTSKSKKSPKKRKKKRKNSRYDSRSPTNSKHSLQYEPQSETSILKEPFRHKQVGETNVSESKFDTQSTSFFVKPPAKPDDGTQPSGGSTASSSNASVGSFVTAVEELNVDRTQPSETGASSASPSNASMQPTKNPIVTEMTVSPLVRATPMASDAKPRTPPNIAKQPMPPTSPQYTE